MKRVFVFLCVATLLLPATMWGQVVDEHHSLWMKALHSSDNPALMYNRYSTKMLEVELSHDVQTANQHLLLETGRGHAFTKLKAQSYRHLDKNLTVWGSAAYVKGMRKDIKFNSTLDYSIIRPYILADSIGGDVDNEQYLFDGGVALKRGRFCWGTSIDFRAEHEYRTVDPRPRNIVTDLSLMFGGAMELGRYNASVGVGTRFYKQTNTVKFFREEGVIPEYHMTGLGSDYVRFSGTNNSSYYKSTGFTGNVNIAPCKLSGVYVQTEYNYLPIKKILPELNALLFSTLALEDCLLRMGWLNVGNISWSVYAEAKGQNRNGTEHVSGNASGTEYRTITCLTMYKEESRLWLLGAFLRVPSINLDVEMRGGYEKNKSSYIEPARSMNISNSFAEIKLQHAAKAGKTALITIDADVDAAKNVNSDMELPLLYMDEARINLMNTDFLGQKANKLQMNLGVRYAYKPTVLKGYGCYAQIKVGFSSYGDYKGKNFCGTIGLSF